MLRPAYAGIGCSPLCRTPWHHSCTRHTNDHGHICPLSVPHPTPPTPPTPQFLVAPYSLLVSLAHLLSLAPLFLGHLLASYPLAAAAEYLTPAALQPFASLKVDLAFIWAFFAFDQFLYVFFFPSFFPPNFDHIP